MSIRVCVIGYPERKIYDLRDLFRFWRIGDNISETVQDRDIVTIDKE